MRETMKNMTTGVLALFFLGLFLGTGTAQEPGLKPPRPENVHLVVLGTSDVHGEILPYDELNDRPATRGMACISSLVRRIREDEPEALLIDNGDTLQGSPLVWFHRSFQPDEPNPMIQAMNEAGYAAMNVGNHEFNFGVEHLASAAAEAFFPILSANIVEGGKPRFKPWLLLERQGVKIGLVSVTTPGIPHWEDPDHYRGLTFTDPLPAFRRAVADVRKAGADVVIGMAHLGLGIDAKTGAPRSWPTYDGNIGERYAREVPGLDGLFLGHTHEAVATEVAGVPVLQPKSGGAFLTRLDLDLEFRRGDEAWVVTKRQGSLIPVTSETPADPPVVMRSSLMFAQLRRYLDTPVGTCPQHLPAFGCAFVDNPLTDLVLTSFLEETGADVALSAIPAGDVELPSGTIRLRHLYRLSTYDNTLVTVTLTAGQLRRILEHSATFFRTWQGQKKQIDLINPDMPYYNCDLAAGVDYEIDLRRPPGRRITRLTRQGRPLADRDEMRVVTTNYRFNGGGDYPSYDRAGNPNRTGVEARTALFRKLWRDGIVQTKADGNWQIIPPEIHALPKGPGPARH
jgi:2',3'-cyclic-nucleotide 2'-phosphodiesterase/3'-nucleotidase